MQRERDDIVEPTGASAPGKPAARMDQPHTVGSSPAEHLYATPPSHENGPSTYALPKAPEGVGPPRWVPPGQPIHIAGITIPGGMIYVGSQSAAPSGGDDEISSLLDPAQPVAETGDFRQGRQPEEQWKPPKPLTYSNASPAERRAYLDWLVDRRDPECHSQYVMLYLYGLERYVISELCDDRHDDQNYSAISDELLRVVSIYTSHTYHWCRYLAVNLLDWTEVNSGKTDKLYQCPVPGFLSYAYGQNFNSSYYLQLALSQAAADGAAVPDSLAFAWMRTNFAVRHNYVDYCSDELYKLFVLRYEQAFANGFVLPKRTNRMRSVLPNQMHGLRLSYYKSHLRMPHIWPELRFNDLSSVLISVERQ